MAKLISIKDFDIFSISLRDDGLYQVIVKSEREFTIACMPDLLSAAKEFGGEKLPFLVICEELSTTNTELMRYLAKEDSNPYSVADAFVINSLNQKMLANFYLKMVQPSRPTQFFMNEHEAVIWLTQYKNPQ
ncbi:MAG TPA: hypothetical protein VNX68_06950 [Nitrosopumilaceae archaeon]|nr:hypothetical protein [Nitrosopumilaceae archaeon]